MRDLYLKEFHVIPDGYDVVKRKGCSGSSPYHYYIRKMNMAKDKKAKKSKDEEVKSKKTVVPEKKGKKSKDAPVSKKKAKTPEPKQSKKDDKPKKTKVAEAVSKKVDGDDWDEQEGGGGDFVKLPTGDYIARCRSVISLGQVIFEFDGKKDTKATSAMGFVLEVWPYKVKKGKVVITASEPAIVYHVMKAHKDNDKSHYTKMMRSFKAKNPGSLEGQAMGVQLYTSDKGYMYVDTAAKRGGKGMYPLAKTDARCNAVPNLTKKGFAIPNLERMTKDAMLELNSITQVKDYVLEAVNFTGSAAEKVVEKIRKEKPDYAKLSGDKAKGAGKEGGKGKGKGKKPKKLSEKGNF